MFYCAKGVKFDKFFFQDQIPNKILGKVTNFIQKIPSNLKDI